MNLPHLRRLLTGLLIFFTATQALCEDPPLPPSFTTTQGKVIKNASIRERTESAIKIMHDGGIATIPHNHLPGEVLAALGISTVAPEEPAMSFPQPFTTGNASYQKAELIGVDPDGIRIKHDQGAAKVRFEDLPPFIIQQVGPFDPKRAEEFRIAEQERNRAVYTAARGAINAAQAAATNAAIANQKNLDDQKQALLSDPQKISDVVNVRISATSSGGKNRDTNWQTYYGSYDRTDTSKRTMVCTITSRSGGFQRVRLQCIFLTRDVSGARELLCEIAADDLVNLGPQVTKTVVAGAITQQTDEKYVMLGLRVKEGAKYVGWTWRAIDAQGRICAVHSSIPAYDRYAWQTPLEEKP
jgi:hypothetical protein